eukprot:5434246-Alexandrium_andersonii.AAC.1
MAVLLQGLPEDPQAGTDAPTSRAARSCGFQAMTRTWQSSSVGAPTRSLECLIKVSSGSTSPARGGR